MLANDLAFGIRSDYLLRYRQLTTIRSTRRSDHHNVNTILQPIQVQKNIPFRKLANNSILTSLFSCFYYSGRDWLIFVLPAHCYLLA